MSKDKEKLYKIKELITSIQNKDEFVGENELWTLVFDIEKILNDNEVQNYGSKNR